MRAPGQLVPLLWQQPIPFAFFRDTPFNCLVIDPATMPPSESAIAEARKTGFEVLPLGAAPALVLGDCAWPRVDAGGKDGAASGPTGLPWIESNGWRILLARAKAPERPVWVRNGKLPEKLALPLASDAYALAVADAAAHGGKWIVELDAELRRGLAAGESRSLLAWRELIAAVEFYLRHDAWSAMRPQAVLGVVSDFAGENEFVATELLNLLSRRQIGYRIILARDASLGDARGLSVLVYAAQAAPTGKLLELFAAFARAGGLSILPAAASAAVQQEGIAEADSHSGFSVRKVGQGRIAVAKQNWDDPYLAARDLHLLMSRRLDHVHLFNASSIKSYAAVSDDGSSVVVHILNYSMRIPSTPVTLAVRKRYRQARLWPLGAGRPAELRMTPEADWLEMPLPPFPVYAAVELLA